AFVFGSGLFFVTVINDTLFHAGIIETTELVPLGAFCFILSQAYLLSSRFSIAFVKTESLSNELSSLNKSLEERIEQRTLELKRSNLNLIELNGKISTQAEHLQAANKEIALANKKLTSSIVYAQRIQEALLIDWELIKKHFPNSFVFFKPRDIVSGDFYWFTYKAGKAIFAMLDCTGHGVPGAFMSIIGNETLNEITKRIPTQDWDCARILTEMDAGIKKALKHDQTNRPDGMDMGICILDKTQKKLQFAGAKIPLVYIQDGEMHRIKGNNRPIGGQTFQKVSPFINHDIAINSSLFFYLYSDGFQDQFGGDKGMKFMAKNFRNLLKEFHNESPEKQSLLLEQALEEWQGNNPQIDDILIMGVGVHQQEL
ncbi:MAG: SpoIIE family protein phosphatase, partial [Flammeovirgaceae bacterium]